ncbi:MAG: hypothetical protein AB7I33_04000 [Gemmatimonadales bacterium]
MKTPFVILAAGLLLVPTLSAQNVSERRLTTADASFNHAFSAIRGVRELPDGRVLVSDGIDEVLMAVDLRTAKADTIGRTGQGPGEYKTPDALFPLPGGATMLTDLGNGRISIFGPDLKYRESFSIAQGGLQNLVIALPRAVDREGRIYFQQAGRPGPGGPPDSAAVVRWDRAGSVYDTVAMVKLPDMKVTSSGGSNNRNQMMRPRPFPAQDTWGVGLDGQVSVVRARDYHVDVVLPGGRSASGPAVNYSPVPIRRADKQEWVDAAADGIGIAVENRNGQMSMSFGRGMRMGDDDDAQIDAQEWPPSKPPFVAGAVWVVDGRTYVERSVPAGSPRQLDVFDGAGKLVSRVILPKSRRVAGFGNGTIYLQRVDDNALQWLERYRM